mgnify:CR=1 FL=1
MAWKIASSLTDKPLTLFLLLISKVISPGQGDSKASHIPWGVFLIAILLFALKDNSWSFHWDGSAV